MSVLGTNDSFVKCLVKVRTLRWLASNPLGLSNGTLGIWYLTLRASIISLGNKSLGCGWPPYSELGSMPEQYPNEMVWEHAAVLTVIERAVFFEQPKLVRGA